MTYEQLLSAYQAQGGQLGTPEQADAFNAWTATLPGGETGDWSQITSTSPAPTITNVPDASIGNGLVPAANPTAPIVPSITPVNSPGGTQGYSQNEVGAQTGGYTSVGATNQTQTGQQSQTQAGTQSTVGNQATTGTSTSVSGVDTPFDLNALTQSTIDSSGADDATRRGFLTDLVTKGGNAFQSQTDQAIRNSLTGPQMIGAGDSARARASGYAAAQVARNDTDQRLNAAQQLAAPSGQVSNVAALSPLFNRTNTTNQAGNVASTGNQTTNNTTNTLDLQDLVSNEAQAGTATGQSVSQGFGVAPAGQTQKAGGCVVCTAYVSRREMKPGAVRRACRYKQANWSRYGTSLEGYLLYGPLIARAVLSSDEFARTFRSLARAILYEEVRLSAPTRVRFRWNAYISHGVFDLLSYPVGLFSKLVGLNTGVRCEKVKALLVNQNLNFSI